jgi:hypothetical protein
MRPSTANPLFLLWFFYNYSVYTNNIYMLFRKNSYSIGIDNKHLYKNILKFWNGKHHKKTFR